MEFDIERAERLNEEAKTLDLLKHETWKNLCAFGKNQTVAWVMKKMDWGYFESMTLVHEVATTSWIPE